MPIDDEAGPDDDALDSKRRQAAVALAGGATVRAAARASGAGERTVARWLAESTFRREVCAVRDRALDSVVGRLTRAALGAADCLAGLLASDDERVRLKAATEILSTMAKIRETVELAARVAELESAAPDGRQAYADAADAIEAAIHKAASTQGGRVEHEQPTSSNRAADRSEPTHPAGAGMDDGADS